MNSGGSPMPGDLLGGRYRLGALLGSGGMATVHRAVDERLGREVAVKLFRVDAAGTASGDRMTAETRLLASLRHPSLVTLLDAAIDGDGHPYLVMELIDGPTLSQRIAEGPVPPPEVAVMAHELAEALHVVHAARVVHRDVKPSNILLDPAPSGRGFRAKLADFGIARLTDSTRLTTPGTVIGTAAFLSPEQVRGDEPGPPADVYALGLVLIEALTARRVYDQASLPETLLARLREQPAVPGDFGYGWRSLLTAMTVDDPARRPTALEVAERALSLVGDGADADATAPETLPPTAVLGEPTAATRLLPASTATSTLIRRPPRARLVAIAVAALLLLGVGGALVWSLGQPDDAPAASTSPGVEADPSTEPSTEPSATPSVEPATETEPEPAVEPEPVEEAPGPGAGNPNSGPGNNSGNNGKGPKADR
jgi:serine/threonine protein kinase